MSESQNVEWKESWRDEYLRWICGFANAQGGKIYIGKRDDGSVVGVENSKKLLEDIPNKIRDILGILVDVNLLKEDGKDVLEIYVAPNSYPVNYKGEYHYRSGSTKQELRGQTLNQFLLKKTGVTWDSIPLDGVSIETFRSDSFNIFREQAVRSGRMDKKDVEVSNEGLLERLNLLEGGNIKRAGILLFSHNPEKWVPGSYVKIGYFESDSDLRYQDEIHGSLIEQADKVVDLIFTKYLKADISYEGVTRIETYPYPKEAIREVVFNAIVHKNYAPLIPIQIKVYKDKLSISNDCVFPEEWTIKDLLGRHRSIAYNPLIANTFFRAGFIEAWGRGIEKIQMSCELAGNKMPEYDVRKTEITVIFSSANVAQDVAQDVAQERTLEEIILNAIRGNNKVTREQIAALANVNKKTIERKLKQMKNIQYHGSGFSGYWIVKE